MGRVTIDLNTLIAVFLAGVLLGLLTRPTPPTPKRQTRRQPATIDFLDKALA